MLNAISSQTKICNACKKRLPADRFNKCARASDGLQFKCRECMKLFVPKSKTKTAGDLKRCKACQKIHPIVMFCIKRKAADGRDYICKECKDSERREYRKTISGKRCQKRYNQKRIKSGEAYRDVRRWGKTKKGIEYTKRNRLKINARASVSAATAMGKIPRAKTLSCSNCGEPAVQYHHHKGYDPANWLDVIAMCRKCHLAADGINVIDL